MIQPASKMAYTSFGKERLKKHSYNTAAIGLYGVLINFNCINLFKEGQKACVNEYFRKLPNE